jgi:hypothetical protein
MLYVIDVVNTWMMSRVLLHCAGCISDVVHWSLTPITHTWGGSDRTWTDQAVSCLRRLSTNRYDWTVAFGGVHAMNPRCCGLDAHDVSVLATGCRLLQGAAIRSCCV